MCLSLVLQAAPISFAWDRSPSLDVTGYRFYGSTNGVQAVSVDTGTNLTVSLDKLRPGAWTFHATAYSRGTNTDGFVYTIESEPSLPLLMRVPVPPANMSTLAVQWIGSLAGTNWTDVGFFRLKIGTP